jgi:hypothetical protein
MTKLLEWISKEKFVQYKDKTWYSPKRFDGIKFTNKHYNTDELINLFIKETNFQKEEVKITYKDILNKILKDIKIK